MDRMEESAHRVAEGFDEAEKSTSAWEKTNRKAVGTTEAQARALDRYSRIQEEAERAAIERRKAEKELKEILDAGKATEEEIQKAIEKTNKAKGKALQLAKERKKAERDVERAAAGLPTEHETKLKINTKDADRASIVSSTMLIVVLNVVRASSPSWAQEPSRLVPRRLA